MGRTSASASCLATLLLLLGSSCCSPAQETALDGEAATVPAYDGPELKATIETAESNPPSYTLVVEVNCPTGGYTLALHELDRSATPPAARFILTAPATDELVFQAFEKHTQRLDLGAERGPVRVLVAQRRRRDPEAGKQPFQLAATVSPH